MSNEDQPEWNADQPTVYQIRLQGHLGSPLAAWLGELTITHEADGNTLLTGPIVDQTALHGLLKRVRDLGIPLLAVNRVDEQFGGNRMDGPHADQ